MHGVRKMPDNITRILATADTETDPFKIGRTVLQPFSWGIYDGETYRDFWGDNATEQLIEYLAHEDTPPMEIYAHNGGRFDWLFIKEHLDPKILMIGNRIVKATIMDGKHELRDSYANMPVPLKSFVTKSGEKIEIDYEKLERHCRERHKKEILHYQKQDVLVLYDAVKAWREMFGEKPLTMASAATNALQASVEELTGEKISKFTEEMDATFRAFYYGGRVETFEKGILQPTAGNVFKVYDINSAYPAAMKNLKHPIGNNWRIGKRINEYTDFAEILAHSKGALPLRNEKGAIHFPHGTFRFFATGHEIREALKHGLLQIKTVFKTYQCDRRASFQDFIDRFYMLRLDAKEQGNAMYTLFYKLVMNSSYGKTAIDPRKFTEMQFLENGYQPVGYSDEQKALAKMTPEERLVAQPLMWRMSEILPTHVIWERNVDTKGKFLNVACGASITGGARANMLAGLVKAKRPIYCDTDSIICEGFTGDIHPTKLGAWDLEATGSVFALAGKKMYALFDDKGECIKKACKGADLTPAEIVRVAAGEAVTWQSPVPVFSLAGNTTLTRTIRNTAKIEKGLPNVPNKFAC